MKKLLIPAFLVMVIFSACSKNTVSDDTENKLTLGTGLGRGTVTGATDTFTLDPQADGVLIQWMLESKIDMGGGYLISILIEERVGDNFIERVLYDYDYTDESFVFYYIDSFYHQIGAGDFRATGLVNNMKVASQTYSVIYGL